MFRMVPQSRTMIAAEMMMPMIGSARGKPSMTPIAPRTTARENATRNSVPSAGCVLVLLLGVGKAVGVGAGLDDGAAEGEPVHDRCAEPRVGEGLRPAGE